MNTNDTKLQESLLESLNDSSASDNAGNFSDWDSQLDSQWQALEDGSDWWRITPDNVSPTLAPASYGTALPTQTLTDQYGVLAVVGRAAHPSILKP